MSEPVRISEMTGIRAQAEEAEAVWPLNVVLIVLGGMILGVAFTFLDTTDSRPLYNPWTYAVATPVVLLGLSSLLSLVVSRVIEKSMQLAFLLSVLIHLILLVCAVNVVIFSRMWPDVLDSLAQQREQLKREALQAKQYHRVSISTQSGRRPDYLKPIETEHQPTEVELSQTAALLLASSARANLVSPSPKIELSHTPHLREREKPATTLPSHSEQAASLSRSDIDAERRAAANSVPPSTVPPAQLEMSPAPPPVSPSLSALTRKSADSTSELQPATIPSLAPTLARSNESPIRYDRVEVTTNGAVASPQSAVNWERRELAQRGPSTQEPQSMAAADAARPLPDVAPSQFSASGRRSNDLSSPVASPPNSLASLPQSAAQRESPHGMRRRHDQPQSPTPAANDSALSLPRTTAGGILGPAAPSSMPIRGVNSLGAPQPTEATAPMVASSTVMTRRSAAPTTLSSQLPQAGVSQSRSWNGTPSLAEGMVGRSPAQLTQAAEDGSAAATDIAGLTGADRAIERSSLNTSGRPGNTAVGDVDRIQDFLVEGSQGRADAATGSSQGAISSPGAALSRSLSGRPSATPHLSPGPLPGQPGSSIDLGQKLSDWKRVARPSENAGGSASDRRAQASLPRSAAAGESIPGVAQVPLPQSLVDAAATAPVPQSVAVVAPSTAPQRNATDVGSMADAAWPTTLLAIDQVVGPGGIAPTLDRKGTLLNRRDATSRLGPPQLESQRFARQDVGGPLAAGQQVALPKPAFQQRIDRLKDRNPQDESSLEPQTEIAIERGLEFLAKHQRPDGSWRLQDFDTPVLMRSDTAATGLALLAFQGAGYTHNQFKYASTVDKAIQFLVQHQAENGDLYIQQDPASDQNAWLYSHAIAALALSEAVGMTQDDNLRPAAQKAIDFMVEGQDPRRGGWRYRPGVGSDTSVTGWFMMAFKSGQLAGLQVPEATFEGIERFLVLSQASETSPYLFRYNPFAANTPQQRHGLEPTSVMTSVGLLMRLYVGWKRDRAEMMAGADHLLEHLPENGSVAMSRRDTYYWYYATQVMFHMRGERWQRWHDRLYPLLIHSQIAEGEMMGSWDPNYPTPDLWARYGGRLYVTTLNLLSLEVSYRHLPLYEATSQ